MPVGYHIVEYLEHDIIEKNGRGAAEEKPPWGVLPVFRGMLVSNGSLLHVFLFCDCAKLKDFLEIPMFRKIITFVLYFGSKCLLRAFFRKGRRSGGTAGIAGLTQA